MSEPPRPKPKWPTRVVRAGDRRSLSRSATRALDVLEFFGEVRRPLRAIEIGRAFGLHPSTVNQLLKTMVESAHLTFDASAKTYLPSPRLTRFASWMVKSFGSDERLRGLIAEVHAQSGHVVTLTTPNDLFMQVIDLAGVDFATANSAERGLRVSIFGTAIGSAYLSTLSLAAFRRLAERARIPEEEQAALLVTLADIRRVGFANGSSVGGAIWSVAAALPEGSFSVPLVLGLAGPAEQVRGNLDGLGALLRTGVLRLAS